MAGRAALYRRALTGYARKHAFVPAYRDEEVLSLTTADGVRLSGARLAGPPDAIASVVLVHGFGHWSRTPRIHAFAHHLARRFEVIVPELRGHGRSGGLSTLGSDEPLDVDAAVAAAAPGRPVVTVGVSLGGAVALLHAGTRDTVAGVVAVSAPAWWAWDTPTTSRIRRRVTSPAGRRVMATVMRTRIAATCAGVPDSQAVVAGISPAFVLVVHDPADHYFGEEHAQTLFRWAGEPRERWIVRGAGHGTDLLTPDLAERLTAFVETGVTKREAQ